MKGEVYYQAVNAVMSLPAYWGLGDNMRRMLLKIATRQAYLSERAFMALMAANGTPRIKERWVEIQKSLGESNTPGEVFNNGS